MCGTAHSVWNRDVALLALNGLFYMFQDELEYIFGFFEWDRIPQYLAQ